MCAFQLVAPYQPAGDQPEAIEELVRRLSEGEKRQVLLGVTGSGKTFTMASVIARMDRPALIFAPNKTLAAQLFSEFKQFFPHNAVEYFVSYYDYYQPEAYVPQSDTFIEKEAMLNAELEKLRLSATRSLFERRDVIVVASVSCIYGLGDPTSYLDLSVKLETSQHLDRTQLLRDLVVIQYTRNNLAFEPGQFRVRGDVVEVYPAYEERAYRLELWGDELEKISTFDPLTGKTLEKLPQLTIWPKTHYVTPQDQLDRAIRAIKEELAEQEEKFRTENKILEMQRLHQRTIYDIEMLKEMGYCTGIENYSRLLEGRAAGTPPSTLLDYFPEDFLLFMDESHVATGQLAGMYLGDQSRKRTLVDFGFRLPSALDNRPLKKEEFEARVNQVVYVSATPGDEEMEKAGGSFVEQVVRPTGLVDPQVEVRPASNQVDDLLEEIRKVVAREERVLVTTLTKKLAEQLTAYYKELGIRTEYLHSEIDTLERVNLLKDLRRGLFDVLVGINLLREGLDLPEVSLVAILDADKEGYLRSARSLIQTIGRAARNVNGKAILYADRITGSMEKAIGETERRRNKQLAHNQLHGITPETVKKNLDDVMGQALAQEFLTPPKEPVAAEEPILYLDDAGFVRALAGIEKQMRDHAQRLDFEKAAELRDRIQRLRKERGPF